MDVPPGMTVVGTNNLLDPAKLAARVREAPDVWAFDPELHLVAPDIGRRRGGVARREGRR